MRFEHNKLQIDDDSMIVARMRCIRKQPLSQCFGFCSLSAQCCTMSSYQTPDSRKEEFRKYLEKSGVIDALTKGELAQSGVQLCSVPHFRVRQCLLVCTRSQSVHPTLLSA